MKRHVKNFVRLNASPFKVHRNLLKPMFYRRGCTHQTPCLGACCEGLEIIHLSLVEAIMRERESLLPLLRPSMRGERLFDASRGVMLDTDHPDRPSYILTSSRPDPDHPRGKSCAFLNSDGLCVLQRHAAMTGDAYRLKPVYCWLYPLLLRDGVVLLGAEDDFIPHEPRIYGKCLVRTSKPILGLHLFEPELRRLLTDPGFEEALSHAPSH